jgi:ABC-type branched-subunit amino acid transport system permease subunit
VGRTLTDIREKATLAKSQGINTFRYRLFVFCLAAFFTGLAGAFYVFHLTIVHPSIFDFYYMQTMLIMVIVGGPGTFWPVVLAALLFTAIPEALRVAEDLRLIAYGVLLVAAMIFLPEGVGGYLKRRLVVAPVDEESDER